MVDVSCEEVIFTISVSPSPERETHFLDWKKRLNAIVPSISGFISIEISVSPTTEDEWIITQRFTDTPSLISWRRSKDYEMLMSDLQHIANNENIKQVISKTDDINNGVTEVIVTRVNPGKETDFREWMAKIHQMEAKFPGFRGAYVQSPISGKGSNWITLLQFDSAENLDKWLNSKEREQVLRGSESLVGSLEQHRVVSPYAGWFASLSNKGGEAPPNWKQAMIVLLVLFPIVVLELVYLKPYVDGLGLSLSTFVGNAISVALVTWMMMPIAIKGLGWWLSPDSERKILINCLGTLVVFFLYFFEVTLFWLLF